MRNRRRPSPKKTTKPAQLTDADVTARLNALAQQFTGANLQPGQLTDLLVRIGAATKSPVQAKPRAATVETALDETRERLAALCLLFHHASEHKCESGIPADIERMAHAYLFHLASDAFADLTRVWDLLNHDHYAAATLAELE